MTPLIINNTREVNCIIQEGVKYCEKSNITSAALGYAILITMVIIGYVVFTVHIIDEYDFDPMKVLLIGYALPLLIIGISLIF